MADFLNDAGQWCSDFLQTYGSIIAIFVLPAALYLTGRHFGHRAGFAKGQRTVLNHSRRYPATPPRNANIGMTPTGSAARANMPIKSAPGPRDWTPGY